MAVYSNRKTGGYCQAIPPLFLIFILFVLIMQLAQHFLELLRHWQPQMAGVLKQADALIAQVEAYDRPSQRRAVAYHMCVQHVTHAHQRDQQTVLVARRVAEPSAQRGNGDLDLDPDQMNEQRMPCGREA